MKGRDLMKIAVCDDQKIILREISNLIEEYSYNNLYEIKDETFLNYNDLKNRIDEFDIFILDYKMPDIDGLTFSKMIRERFMNSKAIIFITAYPEIVYDTFEVRTHRFIQKPIDQNKFFEALDSYMSDISAEKKLIIKNGDFDIVINLDDIYYFEVSRKDTYIYYYDKCMSCRKTIQYFENELEPFNFFRIHRSYLINMNKVKEFNTNFVILKNGEQLSVSPKRYHLLCEKYLKAMQNKL